jgi:hypothetical protein
VAEHLAFQIGAQRFDYLEKVFRLARAFVSDPHGKNAGCKGQKLAANPLDVFVPEDAQDQRGPLVAELLAPRLSQRPRRRRVVRAVEHEPVADLLKTPRPLYRAQGPPAGGVVERDARHFQRLERHGCVPALMRPRQRQFHGFVHRRRD